MSVQQIKAIEELKANDSIDIKLDDKGGGFVVADKEDYISSALNDLGKQRNINEIDPNTDKIALIENVEEEILTIVAKMIEDGEILETTANYITHKSKEHKVARFYCNWKCHKYSPTQTEFSAAAVRGIVSCIGTPDEKVFEPWHAEVEIILDWNQRFSYLD